MLIAYQVAIDLVHDLRPLVERIRKHDSTLAKQLVEKGIRVNAVAPGPVWTPLNAADEGMSPDKVAEFGKKTPLERPSHPDEVAPAYGFLSSEADSIFITGIILPVLGGETIGA
jgi:NAD(P)-dependent dehydrogenase (short-subunit alcohol dehydrogenase family)